MFIKKKRIVDTRPFGSMTIDVLATDKNEIQIQVEKKKFFDDDFFFDLDLIDAIALRDSLNEFIDKRDCPSEGVKTDKTKTICSVNDPLVIVREDTYSNEEIDEMTGRMHRKQYQESQKK